MKIKENFGAGDSFFPFHQIWRVMKLTILMMTLFLVHASASIRAQITLNANKKDLREVLKEIKKQSGYGFIYADQDLKSSRPVSVSLNGATIEQALKACFYNQPLVYEIADKAVMIRRAEEPGLLEKVKEFFESIDVHGRVVDENLQGISGVTITLKNGKGAWTSGTDGSFFIKNLDENATLVFSYLGYEKLETELKGREDLGFVYMKVSTSKLDEVQIQAYGKTSKRISTSNITTIKAEDIAKQPVDNPLYALMGRVPGLIVTPTSGMYGAAVKVQLRGQNSLQDAESEPMFVIDGVPFINTIDGTSNGGTGLNKISALSYINPNEIESIDVLKDADATAIYGSRGANGVVLITTKKGKNGETKISANFNVGFSDVPKFINLMNTQQYIQMRKEAFRNDGLQEPTVADFSTYDLTVYDQNKYTDWQKVLLGGTAKNYSSSVSISGGTSNLQYLVSGNFNDAGYIFPGKSYNKSGTLHFNINGATANQKLRASLTGTYAGNNSLASYDFTNMALTLPPNSPDLYNANGELNWQPNPQSAQGEATWQNPYAKFLTASKMKSNTINAGVDVSYSVLKDLQVKINAGFSNITYNSFSPTPIASLDPSTYRYATGRALVDDNTNSTWSIEPQINYNTSISKGRLTVLLGGSLQNQYQHSQSVSASGYTNDALLSALDYASFGSIIGTTRSSDYKYMGLFGRVNYNFDDRYILNLNARRDGSSRFGPGHQFGNFASAGLAWIFTKERFLDISKSILSFGKLRLSYGINGNDGIGNYQYLELFSPTGIAESYQGVAPIKSLGPANRDYRWESKKSAELGFDLGFFNERLLVSGSYFMSRSSNQLLYATLPATTGSGGLLENDNAKIQNTGAELTLTANNIKTTSFQWTTSGNISFANKNKLLALPDGDAIPARLANLYGPDATATDVIGKPFAGVVAVYESRGVDPVTGTYQFADKDGNTVTGPLVAQFANRYAKLINIAPEFTGGLSNQFSYKGITLDVFLQFTKQKGRNYLYNNSNPLPGLFLSTLGNQPAAFFDNWKQPGDIKVVQKFSQNFDNSLFQMLQGQSDLAWVDASFLRLKNVAISYNFPQSILQKMKLNSLGLTCSIQNAYTITGFKGPDPESQNPLALAPLRTISFGIHAGF